MVTPRFSPTAFLRSFDHAKCANEQAPLPCWSERVLWKSLPGLHDFIRLEVYNKREISTEGAGFGKLYDHDAVVAGFIITSQSETVSATTPASVKFLDLQASFSTESIREIDLSSKVYVTFACGNERLREDGLTSVTALAHDKDSAIKGYVCSWDDEVQLLMGSSLTQESSLPHDYVFLRVNAVQHGPNGHTFIESVGGSVLSIPQLLETMDSVPRDHNGETLVEFEEQLLSGGALCGSISGKVCISSCTQHEPQYSNNLASESDRIPIHEDHESNDKSTMQRSRTSSLKAVSKGLRSIMFGKKKK